MAQQQSPRQPARVLPAHERNGQHSLMTLLGFKKAAEHIDELRLFYLIGCTTIAGRGLCGGSPQCSRQWRRE